MTPNILWLYWEMPSGASALPAHVALCRMSMETNLRDAELRLVTPNNLNDFLPGLSRRLFKVALNPKGRLDKYFNRAGRRRAAIAQRADYIRAFLLEKYGGYYIDSDAVLLGSLERYFALLDNHDFCVTRRSSFGKSHVSVNFYGSRAGGKVISAYANALRERLEKGLDYDWNEVGATMLTPIVDRYADLVHEIPEAEVQPVTFENADEIFADESLELAETVPEEARIFMLYHRPFETTLRGMGIEDLYRGRMLISKAFRAAIPEAEFIKLRDSYRR